METLKDLQKLYDLQAIDLVTNMIFCDNETNAFGEGILFGIRMAMAVITERGAKND